MLPHAPAHRKWHSTFTRADITTHIHTPEIKSLKNIRSKIMCMEWKTMGQHKIRNWPSSDLDMDDMGSQHWLWLLRFVRCFVCLREHSEHLRLRRWRYCTHWPRPGYYHWIRFCPLPVLHLLLQPRSACGNLDGRLLCAQCVGQALQ